MPIQSFQLDPDAQAYVDLADLDSIAAAKLAGIEALADVSPVDTDELTEGITNLYDTGVPPADLEALPDGATRKAMLDAEKTKLTGIEDLATADLVGTEIRDLIVGIAAVDRKILISDPVVAGNFKVIELVRLADGKLDVRYDDVPIP